MSGNGVLIALGLGAVAAAVIVATSKKKDDKLASGPIPGRFDPTQIRSQSPGQPGFPMPRYTVPAGWTAMTQEQKAQFCFANLGNPQWQGFCQNYYIQQAGG